MLAQISSISADGIFWLSIFGFNYLGQFSINLRISCANLGANFRNFPKDPQICMVLKEVMGTYPRISKIRKYANLI